MHWLSRLEMLPLLQASLGWHAPSFDLHMTTLSPSALLCRLLQLHTEVRSVCVDREPLRQSQTNAALCCPNSETRTLQGFITALMGNTQLLGYFLDKGERSAAAVQGIGVVSNYGVLFQACPPLHLHRILTKPS